MHTSLLCCIDLLNNMLRGQQPSRNKLPAANCMACLAHSGIVHTIMMLDDKAKTINHVKFRVYTDIDPTNASPPQSPTSDMILIPNAARILPETALKHRSSGFDDASCGARCNKPEPTTIASQHRRPTTNDQFSSLAADCIGYVSLTSVHDKDWSTRRRSTDATSAEGTRTCAIESLSRSVTVPSFSVAKSTVTANGTPISSVRAYRFPTVVDPVSTMLASRLAVSDTDTRRASSFNSSLWRREKTVALTGATRGLNRNTVLASLPSPCGTPEIP